eukprot:3373624-Alexandrium_andersonii.AAC.1
MRTVLRLVVPGYKASIVPEYPRSPFRKISSSLARFGDRRLSRILMLRRHSGKSGTGFGKSRHGTSPRSENGVTSEPRHSDRER